MQTSLKIYDNESASEIENHSSLKLDLSLKEKGWF